ncbi:1-deoxy-D-xylulose-5-phosphate synthase [Syntrophorhabdus aromaticivorans]|uniref:1-deoxy-D-xylulose-5-phosphate synthase n=1 Tax=Syntrophorhabdus aromaticivorans TaxID=328301 RepID=A0A351U0V0_9BACT|nr:1-deoxy-D-xylulose-5-phosphate synthase [Syntrophorhabdus aromaticivorans]NLW35015.1 1-deoxy-D-xylulose-5-phosphate synthase [Syntrophorhabdus aromaticivorans]HBA53581.1 1-deoxy-D-xylulose-5-phosphate synthase [Syntrophorhabdus aromaticivorans]
MLEKNLNPRDIRLLSPRQLDDLTREIREVIIATVSVNGGHLASSLGVVEIALALHRVFDTPNDKIVWDVGHQCYPHKLITGRFDRFHTLRQFGGIAGFPKSSESPFDNFNTGHSGTSISAALGMAVQRDLAGKSHKVIAVIGDGSLTNGMALEAMNHAGFMGTDIIIVLNDNEKSISRNVGAYSKYLSRLRVELVYMRKKQKLKKFLHYTKPGYRASSNPFVQFKERIKHILTPSRTGAVFQELGFAYIGPIDGHDIQLLCEVFESIKDLKGPILIHAVTSKGKGYKFAEEDSTKFHGVGAFNSKNGKAEKASKKPSYTSVFGSTLMSLAEKDEKIVAITAAMQDGTGLTNFRKAFPTRFFDVGIAEEHAVTFAAGLAKEGAKPFVAIYSTFLQRAYDQVLHDVCLQNLPVRFMIDRGGLVGEDGPTHHGVFDLSYLRQLPNMILMSPKDENELRHMVKTALEYNGGPIAVRYPRSEGVGVMLDRDIFSIPIGSWESLESGHDVALLAVGSMVYPSLEAASLLKKEGLDVEVINARSIKPLDDPLLTRIAGRHRFIVTLEENVLAGGFGSAVAEFLADHDFHGISVERIGLPDCFVEHGAQALLRGHYGLSPDKIAGTIRSFLERNLSTADKGTGSKDRADIYQKHIGSTEASAFWRNRAG